jgi:hypothetical protein
VVPILFLFFGWDMLFIVRVLFTEEGFQAFEMVVAWPGYAEA